MELMEYAADIAGLAVFRGLRRDPVVDALYRLLTAEGLPLLERADRWGAFAAAVYARGGDLADCLADLVRYDDNPYYRACAAGGAGEALRACAQREIALLEALSQLTPSVLGNALGCPGLPAWHTHEADFGALVQDRVGNLSTQGWGVYTRHRMFRLRQGLITPATSPDPVRWADLTGYEPERETVLMNTRALLQGRPAANVLLYGDAGTGKSTTVKAIVNELADEGLRLIELTPEQAPQLPDVAAELQDNPLKFIVFIDDLSFDRGHDGFNALKAVLEGSSMSRSGNVAIYVTSNRRRLVRESFADREGDDIHRGENLEELGSLSQRFGLTVRFEKPGRALYLRIARALRDQYGLMMDDVELDARAERWALSRGGRSPRAARQLVEHLVSLGEYQ